MGELTDEPLLAIFTKALQVTLSISPATLADNNEGLNIEVITNIKLVLLGLSN